MNWILNIVLGWVKNYFVKNWRTTVAAVVAFICLKVPALAEYKEQIIEIALLVIGLLAKDGSTTGTAATDAAADATAGMGVAPGGNG